MKKNKKRITRYITKFVEQLERGERPESNVRTQVEQYISFLPSDEAVRQRSTGDTTLDNAIRDALVVAGLKVRSIARILVEKISTDARVRQQLAGIVARISLHDSHYEDELIELADNRRPAVRLAAVWALCMEQPDAAAAADMLIFLQNHPLCYQEATDFVSTQLVWHCLESRAACDALLESIRTGFDASRKDRLTDVLVQLVKVNKDIVVWLLERRNEPDLDLRKRIAYAISESPYLIEVYPQLVASTESFNAKMILYILGEVRDFNRHDLVPLCRKALQDPDDVVRCGALIGFGKLGPLANDAFDEVCKAAFEDGSAVNRALAMKALAAIDLPRAQDEAAKRMQ